MIPSHMERRVKTKARKILCNLCIEYNLTPTELYRFTDPKSTEYDPDLNLMLSPYLRNELRKWLRELASAKKVRHIYV